jgi:TetR/AcrR family transcriptional regulator, copper-responsive repressor
MARRRNFEEDEVLDRAMDVFWRSGYEGSSMAELTSAMGLSAPSIYGAFHSKRGLFDAVLDRYADRQSEHGVWILSAPTAREVAERMLFRAADELNGKNHPPGCLLIQAGLTAGPENHDIPKDLAQRRRAKELALRDRFERAVAEGDLPADADAAALASFVVAVFGGLGIQAAAGASRNELRRIAERAMAGWPARTAGMQRGQTPQPEAAPADLSANSAGRGRPREFNEAVALNAAMLVFWRQGYEGTSLTDLTDAMGITRPSLYAAFGNKESLFRQALDLYEQEKLSYVAEALTAPTARGVAERLLRGALERQVSGGEPRGCLGVLTSMQLSAETRGIREEVAARSALQSAAIVARFERARAEGDLPQTAEPLGLARMLLAVVHGLIVQSSLGASPVELQALVDSALALWPSQ